MSLRIVLTGRKRLETEECSGHIPRPEGEERMRVLCCAVCRTDAKMWAEGHRDLILPRVPGHEMVVEDELKKLWVVWPGSSCGKCHYCLSGRENLCEYMRITGFHRDGGFADFVTAPRKSLISVPEHLPLSAACLAEPAGCVLHALETGRVKPGDQVLVYGGGTMGLLAALAAEDAGALPLVIEKNPEKIKSARNFFKKTGIDCLQEAGNKSFDAVINACPDEKAFLKGLSGLKKGGRFVFFSGLTKGRDIETNLVNTIHYREITLSGSYGLTRQNMRRAVSLLEKHHHAAEDLIQEAVPPEEAPLLMPKVLAGRNFRYILDFSGSLAGSYKTGKKQGKSLQKTGDTAKSPGESNEIRNFCESVINSIRPVNSGLKHEAQKKIDGKTKPPGSLGRVEELAVQMCLIQSSLSPAARNKQVFVFAGDHGIVEEGISAYPAEVTAQMVENFLNKGAAINIVCSHNSIGMKVIDMGVVKDIEAGPELICKKTARGTRNFAREAAMSREQAFCALKSGMEVFLDAHEERPVDILGLGEMGIGNTTSASAIISAAAGISPEQAAGRGTGLDEKGVQHKAAVIKKALDLHQPDSGSGLDLLTKLGGFEIAGIAGAALAAASKNTAVVLDGVISTAAGLIALLINPSIKGYLIAGHKSEEPGHQAALDFIGTSPALLDLGMRLGEGTGAGLAINLVEAACRIMTRMASFEEAGISGPAD